ncbi:hypothetical protein HDA45_008194 [Amycolatopsis umgeniensis]|uniref:Uncharacterized protein n=1 Tax=Amycolatopsis umgeniensis TaxID=336628 RepID=A0A841BFJ1_9PSEU|nr:hypothetical protein [Amycolatopsis umgeniensis]
MRWPVTPVRRSGAASTAAIGPSSTGERSAKPIAARIPPWPPTAMRAGSVPVNAIIVARPQPRPAASTITAPITRIRLVRPVSTLASRIASIVPRLVTWRAVTAAAATAARSVIPVPIASAIGPNRASRPAGTRPVSPRSRTSHRPPRTDGTTAMAEARTATAAASTVIIRPIWDGATPALLSNAISGARCLISSDSVESVANRTITRPQPPTTHAISSSVFPASGPAPVRVSKRDANVIRIVAPKNIAAKLARNPAGRRRSDDSASLIVIMKVLPSSLPQD